jgi:hypothetical protein
MAARSKNEDFANNDLRKSIAAQGFRGSFIDAPTETDHALSIYTQVGRGRRF